MASPAQKNNTFDSTLCDVVATSRKHNKCTLILLRGGRHLGSVQTPACSTEKALPCTVVSPQALAALARTHKRLLGH